MKKHIIFSIALTIMLIFSLSGCERLHQHSIVIEPEIPATDTTDGVSEKRYCEICGEIIKEAKSIPALLQGTDIKAPSFTADGETLHLEIPEDIKTINLGDEIQTNDTSRWVLSLDESGTETVDSKTVSLSRGENKFYIIVTDKNENSKKYNVIITTLRNNNLVYLSFDAYGGSLSTDCPEAYDRTANSPLPLPTPTLTYYNFKGWSLNSDGTGTLYTELPVGLELTEEQIESGLFLYAVWERKVGFV